MKFCIFSLCYAFPTWTYTFPQWYRHGQLLPTVISLSPDGAIQRSVVILDSFELYELAFITYMYEIYN